MSRSASAFWSPSRAQPAGVGTELDVVDRGVGAFVEQPPHGRAVAVDRGPVQPGSAEEPGMVDLARRVRAASGRRRCCRCGTRGRRPRTRWRSGSVVGRRFSHEPSGELRVARPGRARVRSAPLEEPAHEVDPSEAGGVVERRHRTGVDRAADRRSRCRGFPPTGAASRPSWSPRRSATRGRACSRATSSWSCSAARCSAFLPTASVTSRSSGAASRIARTCFTSPAAAAASNVAAGSDTPRG